MIWLNPRRVTIGSTQLSHVSSVVINRVANKLAVEYSDLGPQAAFADVPEERVTIKIKRAVTSGGAGDLRPGDRAALSFRTAPSAADAVTREINAEVVLTAVEHTVDATRGGAQTIDAVAVSPDGLTDPVSESVVSNP